MNTFKMTFKEYDCLSDIFEKYPRPETYPTGKDFDEIQKRLTDKNERLSLVSYLIYLSEKGDEDKTKELNSFLNKTLIIF